MTISINTLQNLGNNLTKKNFPCDNVTVRKQGMRNKESVPHRNKGFTMRVHMGFFLL